MAKTHSTERKTEKKWYSAYQSEKFWATTFTIIFLALALLTAISLRLATKDLDLADRWAAQSIQQQGVSQFANEIRKQYPTLPDAQVQAEAQKRFEAYAKDNKEALEAQQTAIADQLRGFFQYETGRDEKYNQTYVLEMDPYYFWTKAVNYADHGTICDKDVPVDADGSCTDSKRLAPIGTHEGPNLHVVLEAWMINSVHAFNDNLDTLTIIFYLPVILAALAVIPAFFIGRRVAGNIGGFVAAMIIATHPVLMNRTIAGFSDTDGYNFLFPLLIIWLIFEAIVAKKWWSKLTLAALAGITVGIFGFAWAGWWMIFFIILVSFIAYLAYTVIVLLRRHSLKSKTAQRELLMHGATFLTFFIASALAVTAFIGFSQFTTSFTAPFAFNVNLQAPTNAGLEGWPNILTTVAELNVPSLATIIGNLGGKLLVVFAAFGLFVTLINPRKLNWTTGALAAAVFVYYLLLISKGLELSSVTFLVLFAAPLVLAVAYIFFQDLDIDLRYAVFLMGWLLATLFATTRGIRFLLLGIPPFAIGFGIAIGWLFIAITDAIDRERKQPVLTHGIVGAIILLLVFNPAAAYSPLANGRAAAQQQLPGMNDAWWDAMTIIREQTPPDTIITSWWDFGHWFRNIGNRSVTFDGGSQNPQPGHWVGKTLLTNNETQALGILRMLDCGQNTAFEVAHKTLPVVESKTLVDELILVDRTTAQKRLAQTTIPSEDQQAILEATHCTPPPAVFITSGDMIGKAGVWGHFGSWNFTRAMAYHYATSLPQQQAIQQIQTLGLDEAQATEMYFSIQALQTNAEGNAWISGWPNYYTQALQACTEQNNTITCTFYAALTQVQQGTLVIDSVTFTKNNPAEAKINYGVYANGQRLGGDTVEPNKVAYAHAGTITTSTNTDAPFGLGVLVEQTNSGNQTSYKALLADPQQVDSLFTQLYFLDGRYTPHFTKFVERYELGGSKIIVWKVTWPED